MLAPLSSWTSSLVVVVLLLLLPPTVSVHLASAFSINASSALVQTEPKVELFSVTLSQAEVASSSALLLIVEQMSMLAPLSSWTSSLVVVVVVLLLLLPPTVSVHLASAFSINASSAFVQTEPKVELFSVTLSQTLVARSPALVLIVEQMSMLAPLCSWTSSSPTVSVHLASNFSINASSALVQTEPKVELFSVTLSQAEVASSSALLLIVEQM